MGEQARLPPCVRVCRGGTRHRAGEHSFRTVVKGVRERTTDGRLYCGLFLRKESMAELIAAARDGNGPRVEVATPTLLVAECRGLWQRACCCRSVASTPAPSFHECSLHNGLLRWPQYRFSGRIPSPRVFPRGRTPKPKSRPDASPRKFSHKSKAEDTEEDSQQEDDDKDEHIDSNNAGDTRIQL